MWSTAIWRRFILPERGLCFRRDFSSTVYVSRLSYYTSDEDFENMFSRFGRVEEARLIRDARTNRPKGFGFVTYASDAEAEKAIKSMDGRIYGGRLIFVEYAKSGSQEDKT
ncbi:small RNA-binding protein 11, chloroplastic-like isoform X1 [Musa acuminata AAA Group]|uniref:small RNA-binding protein 11, chloroplastic-like isoform X1 n=1 Tax=Musa acuminata AAA Group TaxID=214697 RepID=UPI0031D4B99E